ncbi:MAG: hypothetical protein OEY85_14440, partial [Rhodospirillales bacterium]|nr:hypothetical protein [Rhodospirillales bacterium]
MAPVDQLPEEVPKENEDTIPVGLTDGLAFKPIAPPKTKKRHGLRFLLLLLLLGGAGYAGWTVYGDRLEEKNTAGVPLIRADFGPIKTRPASPGGMEVPDRDKLVYDRISNSGDRTKVERLLPKSEEPKAPPVAVAAPGSVAPPPVTDRLHPVNTARKIPTQPSDIQSTVPTTEEVLSAAPPPPPPPPEPVKTAMKTPEVAPAAGTPDPSTAAGDTYQV